MTDKELLELYSDYLITYLTQCELLELIGGQEKHPGAGFLALICCCFPVTSIK